MTKCAPGESARMTWPKAIRIEGNGQYASVSFCAPGPTVVLCRSYAEAKALKREIDDTGCGAQCTKKHGIFDVGLPRITTEHDFITADLPPTGGSDLLSRLRARWRRDQRAPSGRPARRQAEGRSRQSNAMRGAGSPRNAGVSHGRWEMWK